MPSRPRKRGPRSIPTGRVAARARLFESAFDDAAVGQALMGADGRPIRVNRAACEMMGYSAKELLTKNWRELTHPDDIEATAQKIAQAAASADGRSRLVKRYVRKDGSVFWAVASTTAVRDAGAGVRHFITTFVDVTAQKEAEEALRASRALFRTLAEQSPVAIFQTDVFGDIVYGNPACVRITGLTYEQALGKGWREAVHPDDRERVAEAWYRAVEERRVYREEVRFLRPDGTITRAVVKGTAIRDEEGFVSGYIGVAEELEG